ncbi:leucine-rich repeat domain-containing protein [Flammeovirga agarivorans]|uniref:Disease resistance R13L4/SHOC-2-like LRR domain-containing protein n=1 Tax=Flammeovirga agarivorans TaxID=2726742 RepID=A0A7X8SKH6_9BACT|nr:leucine-rich repeat domain-containing protein [Flammeovirga agarivorans]NLR91881.1 hypothetical protein [Flammeovirga agarivorans]
MKLFNSSWLSLSVLAFVFFYSCDSTKDEQTTEWENGNLVLSEMHLNIETSVHSEILALEPSDVLITATLSGRQAGHEITNETHELGVGSYTVNITNNPESIGTPAFKYETTIDIKANEDTNLSFEEKLTDINVLVIELEEEYKNAFKNLSLEITALDGTLLASTDQVGENKAIYPISGAFFITAVSEDAKNSKFLTSYAEFSSISTSSSIVKTSDIIDLQEGFSDKATLLAIKDVFYQIDETNLDRYNWDASLELKDFTNVEVNGDNRIRELYIRGLDRDFQLHGTLMFPRDLANLTDVVNLKFNYNYFSLFPNEINQLTKLKIFNVYDTSFDDLPSTLAELSITELNMGQTIISGPLPAVVTKMKTLEKLSISDNGNMDPTPDLSVLPNLEVLYMSYCWDAFRTLPNWLFKCTNLKALSFSGNYIKSIPNDINKLVNLEVLYMGSNEITYLPESLADLTKLKTLYVGNNKINTEFPSFLLEYEDMENLYINNNEFTGEIPEGLSNLTNLKILKLEGNSFTGEIPQAILDMDLEELTFDEANERTM